MTKSSHSTFAQPISRLQLPAIAAALMLLHGSVSAREVQLKVNNLLPIRLKANESGTAMAQDGQSVAYFANNVPGQLNRRTLQVRLAEPFLCADFSTGVSDNRLRLRLVQSNNDIQDFGTRGFAGLQNLVPGTANVADTGGIRYSYDPSNANLSLLKISTNDLVCYDFSADSIFSDGFESLNRVKNGALTTVDASARAPLADVDLSTTIRTLAGLPLETARPGAQLDYAITVTNNGTITANNVQVRDYFPKRTNVANGNASGAAFTNGTWRCTATGGADCGPSVSGNNNTYVFLSGASLPLFGTLRIEVSRTLSNSPTLPDRSAFSLQAAAFVAPAENEDITGNNAVSVALRAVINSNPVISIASNPPRTRGGCQSLFINPCEFTINVSDPDGQPEAVTLTASSLDASNLAVSTPPPLSPTLRRVFYAINPAFGGTLNVTVRGTDTSGGFSEINVPILITDPQPTISDVADLLPRDEDNGATGSSSTLMVIGPIAVTIGGDGVDLNAALFTAASLDLGVIPQSAIDVGGAGANRTVTITVPRHAYNSLNATVGTPSNIRLTVRNGSAPPASDEFKVRLIAVNDPPVLNVVPELSFTGPISINLNGSFPNWIVSSSVGADNEANPPAESGVAAQSLTNPGIFVAPQQTIPAILVSSPLPSLIGAAVSTLQFRWVSSPQPAGAACVFAEVSEVNIGQAGGPLATKATGKIRMNGGDVTCGPPPLRKASK